MLAIHSALCLFLTPRQTGILLIGGVKGGKGWTEKMVARADKIYEQYLREIKKEGLI
jgi:hypothetical protein